MTQQCISHTAPTLTVLVKNTHLAEVWFGHNTDCQAHFSYVPLIFGVVLFAKVCFFLPVQF